MLEKKIKIIEGITVKVIRNGEVIVDREIDNEKEKDRLTGERRRKE